MNLRPPAPKAGALNQAALRPEYCSSILRYYKLVYVIKKRELFSKNKMGVMEINQRLCLQVELQEKLYFIQRVLKCNIAVRTDVIVVVNHGQPFKPSSS